MAKHLFDHKTAKAKLQLRPDQAKPSKAKHRAIAKAVVNRERNALKRTREWERKERE